MARGIAVAWPVTLVAALGLAATPAAHAQQVDGQPGNTKTTHARKTRAHDSTPDKGPPDEQVIVTGTRTPNKRARQSSSPVTVISAATLQHSGLPNVAEALARTYPSINIQAMGQNADALTSSIRMRGLNPDQVLVLVDGVRRHTTANFSTGAGVNFGSTPVDLNMIPASDIDHIEVLEDGAAALYGSDAIAGVINIITKKKASGLHVSESTGANANNGDGWTEQLDADGGMALGNDGYLHIAGEYEHRDDSVIHSIDHRLIENQAPAGAYTSIGYTGTQPVPLYSNQVTNVPEETRESLAINAGKSITSDIDSYGSITYAHRHSQAFEQYRLPTIAPTVYPAGFEPLDIGEENDYSATLGLKGTTILGFDWNLSTTYGADDVNLSTSNNIALGMLKTTCTTTNTSSVYYSADGCGYAKTKFFLKSLDSSQWDNRLDLRRGVTLPLNIPMNIAFGAEHRLETYALGAGEPASYQDGGPQAIVGLTPENAGSWDRDIYAGYGDLDLKPLPHWDVDVAGRVEHYTDSGDNTQNGKISSRYDINRRVAVRATISNGFRAPTLAEQHYSSASLQPTAAGGLLPANSAAAESLGATPLKPERSWNLSGGFVLEPIDGWHWEIDAYQIAIRDRLVESNAYSGAAAIAALADFGFNVPSTITPSAVTAQYITNGASTRTQGLDIKTDYTVHLRNGWGRVLLTAALDLNRTRISHLATNSAGTPLLNAQAISLFTTEYPRSKAIVDALWTVGRFDVNLRESRYGQTKSLLTYEDWATGTCPNGTAKLYSTSCWYQYKNRPRYLTDLEVGYRIGPRWHVAIGGDNIFDVRPSEIPSYVQYNGTNIYDTYSSGIPMTGGYYYGRLDFTF